MGSNEQPGALQKPLRGKTTTNPYNHRSDWLTSNKDWNPIVRGVANAAPYIKTYPICAVTPLDSFIFDGHVALLGDAAHAHGGGVAIGGSLAINDAYAFALALTHVWPPSDDNTPTSPH